MPRGAPTRQPRVNCGHAHERSWLAGSVLHMQRELTPAEEEDEVAGSSWRQPLARAAASYALRVRAR